MLNGRKSVIAGVAGLALAATIGVTATQPATATPDIKDVQARVDKLYTQAEQASERYNEAELRLSTLNGELDSLEADQERQSRKLTTVRTQLRESMLRQFEGSNLSAVGQVVVSDDPEKFLSGLTTMSDFDSIQAGLYERFATEAQALELREKATQKRADQVAKTKKQMAAEKAAIDKKYDEAKGLLGRLKEKERQALVSRSTSERVPTASDIPASGRAAAAVAYAMAQVGDAYVWGATGESAFDCSGLTMRAWGAAGVSLPHSSRAQAGMGRPVGRGELQPGDLLFYYSPISHVAMYIGNGQIVHAARPGVGVTVGPAFSMPYSGAVRPG